MNQYVSPPDTQLPANFQGDDTDYMLAIMRSGESCSLIGIGSVGKSNLLRSLVRLEVKQKILAEDAPFYVTILLDPHLLVHSGSRAMDIGGPNWPGYELMLSGLRRAMWELNEKNMLPATANPEDSLVRRTEQGYLRLLNDNPLLAQTGMRQLEDCIYDLLVLDERWKVVFLFDELEDFMAHLPATFFQSLRGLRDNFKQRVMYITTSRKDIHELVEHYAHTIWAKDERYSEVIEGFAELLHEHTHYVRLFDEENMRSSLNRFLKRYGLTNQFTESQQRHLNRALFAITGGHIGLARRAFLSEVDLYKKGYLGDPAQRNYPPDAVLDMLLTDEGIHKECTIIFNSLPEAEQDALRQLALFRPVASGRALGRLITKRLVYQDTVPTGQLQPPQPPQPQFTIPLLQRYVATLDDPNRPQPPL